MAERISAAMSVIMVSLALWLAHSVQAVDKAVAVIVERVNAHEQRIMALEADTRFQRRGG